MNVSELIDYLVRTNADPNATLFIETDTQRLELKCIIEDKQGVYLSSEE